MKSQIEACRTFLAKIAAVAKEDAYAKIGPRSCDAVYRYAMVVWGNQLREEQLARATVVQNGVGLTGADGSNPALCDMLTKAARYGSLTPGQARYVASKMVKYARQIVAGVPAAPKPAVEPVRHDDYPALEVATSATRVTPRSTQCRSLGGDVGVEYKTDAFGRQATVRKPIARKKAVDPNRPPTKSELAFDRVLLEWGITP